MSTPVVEQLYFLEKRHARLASCAWASVYTAARQAKAPLRLVSPAPHRLAAVELLHALSRFQNAQLPGLGSSIFRGARQ